MEAAELALENILEVGEVVLLRLVIQMEMDMVVMELAII